MTIKQIIEKIDKDYRYNSDYHTIERDDVVELLELLETKEADADYKTMDELRDRLYYYGLGFEMADNNCPIYYADIAKWFGDNWQAVDEAIEEGIIDSTSIKDEGIMKALQCAYVMTYERGLVDALECLANDIFTDENK